jgi:hypothetical protein
MCEALQPGAFVITVSQPLPSSTFARLECRKYTMSIGTITVYIQRRLG